MPDSFTCPYCQATVSLDSGVVLKCPKCGKPLHCPVGKKEETGIFNVPEDSGKDSHSPKAAGILREMNGDFSSKGRLGPYQIIRIIGRGGMGHVYEVVDTRLNRRVALKALENASDASGQMAKRFHQEARNVARLNHPHIVSIYDVGSNEGFDYFTMDLVEGVTLDKWAIETTPTLFSRLMIFEKIARALHYAHQQGVIHRDIKPGNIMVDSNGEPKLMDFGLARNTRESSTLTLGGNIVGTPAYMAPEQVMGSSAPLSFSTDIWGMGVMMYEIFTGKIPFDTGNVYQTIYAVLHEDPDPPRARHPDLDQDLETIILHCMEKKVEKRYRSALDLADDLRAIQENRPIGIRPMSRWEKIKKFIQKKKAISMDEFVREQQARQKAEAQRLELQNRVENESRREWNLIFEDDFSDPNVLDRWEIYGGDWAIENDEFRIQSGHPQILYLRQPVSGDVRIEFECRQEGGYLGDISCFISAFPGERLQNACDSGYMFQFGANENTRSFLEKSGERIWEKMGLIIQEKETYRVLAEKKDKILSLTINGQLIFEVEDGDVWVDSERTGVGIYGWGARTFIRYVKVFQLGVPVKLDVITMAQRQFERGKMESAMDLLQEILRTPLDPHRREQANNLKKLLNERLVLGKKFQACKEQLQKVWPSSHLELEGAGFALDIRNVPVNDLSPIQGMPLIKIRCLRNQIKSLEPLRGMLLEWMDIPRNQVEDLDPVRGMPLQRVNLNSNPVHSLEPLKNAPLQHLNLENIRGLSMDILSSWKLDTLGSSRANIRSLDFIRNHPSIKNLHLSQNQITDLSPLRGQALSVLKISFNQIRSLEPLMDVPLQELDCQGNLIETLEPYFKNPPKRFWFDSETLSASELRRAVHAWSVNSDYQGHVRNAEILIRVKEKNWKDLRKMAQPFNGCSYLLIPKFMAWEEACKICQETGGFMLEKWTDQEMTFIKQELKYSHQTWAGVYFKEGLAYYSSGEPVGISMPDMMIAKPYYPEMGYGYFTITGKILYFSSSQPGSMERGVYPLLIKWKIQ